MYEFAQFKPLLLPCGGAAHFDTESGCSFKCHKCNATVGSPEQPRACVEAAEKYEQWEKLGGKGWDLIKGTVNE